ncbi:hypothetical protein GUITHDRAFT_121761 [Guillardia theta CCMP2712]|uniref:Uncharacterized protein n=1 Tax=Guillardia theta (strain CCMP2712) TaxID=905079 RepID=L1I730_GUITC|nr:hypothetical protein GUITHDRAFT_121761 [Guillardia theta CCMP2712]EKX32061.1 hypothetical protein GUITHDRAFT_121761 [Guillardia theta CCMP2712]|eukprot:XP_005819041.1 hypothetical protein GUITHDRAFT_121761 [Guillardia theta CCMP2712]
MRKVWELWTTAILNSLSNFLVLPAIRIAHRPPLRDGTMEFRVMFAIFGLISSSLYHFCEPLGIRVLNMNDGQWHRLDNVAAIMCFVNLFVYLSDFREEWHGEYLKYFMLGLTLILQESGPWELKNTLVPILIAACFPFLRYILARKKPDYDWRNFYLGWGLMGVAFVFFVNG